jgi:hypothetical protein
MAERTIGGEEPRASQTAIAISGAQAWRNTTGSANETDARRKICRRGSCIVSSRHASRRTHGRIAVDGYNTAYARHRDLPKVRQ